MRHHSKSPLRIRPKGYAPQIKRVIASLLTLFLLIPLISAYADGGTQGPQSIRVVVDGTVYNISGYFMDGAHWCTGSTIQNLLGELDTAIAADINNAAHYRLSDTAEKMGASFEYDEVLDAIYIWTDLGVNKLGIADELARAESFGFGEPSGQTITYAAFMQMLDKMVELADRTKLEAWQAEFIEARAANENMSRADGMMLMLSAALTLGGEYAEFNTDWMQSSRLIGEDDYLKAFNVSNVFRYAPNHHPFGSGKGFLNFDVSGWDKYGVAYHYVIGRMSYVSGRSIFDYDAQRKAVRPDEPLTVEEALLACTRLLDSSLQGEIWAPLSQVGTYDKHIIRDELIQKADALPALTDDDRPVWKGFVFNADYHAASIDHVTEYDLRTLAEWGFNSVRVAFPYQALFDEGVTEVNVANLLKLDMLIAHAIQYNLHLNILTISLPGRWALYDDNTTESIGDFDLFINPERQEEATALWSFLAKRYEGIPSAVLSFCPIWEATNYNLSTGLPYPEYNDTDIAITYSKLIAAIRENDPGRFIVYEPTSVNATREEVACTQELVEGTYSDVLMITNCVESPFVYANGPAATSGVHIDFSSQAMFKPEYPTTYYATQQTIRNKEALVLNGALKAGTEISIYLSETSGAGAFTIKADGKELHSEQLSARKYQVEVPLSYWVPYAVSDKGISVTLPSDTEKLEIQYTGQWFAWSGINVTLPDENAVRRWWFPTGYQAILDGEVFETEEEFISYIRPTLKETSTVLISPTIDYEEASRLITIHTDISYSTEEIYQQANRQTIAAAVDAISDFAPRSVIRFERAEFSGGALEPIMRYYSDLLTELNAHDLSWYSNDWDNIISYIPVGVLTLAGSTLTPYRGYYIDAELLGLLQSFQ